MTISELQKKLEEFQERYGDVAVALWRTEAADQEIGVGPMPALRDVKLVDFGISRGLPVCVID